jgi:hypothetical protein
MHEPSLSLAAPEAAPTATRGRPRLALTDDQARSLAQQTDVLIAKHAGSTGGHRQFVHDFIRAVYHATGETYGAARYRQLLGAYAPQCRPSTSTIELEKNQLLDDLRQRAVPSSRTDGLGPASVPLAEATVPAPGQPGTDLALQQVLSQLHTVSGQVAQLANASVPAQLPTGLVAHNDYLSERLASVEAELATARATAARAAAAAQAADALAAERGAALESAQAVTAAMTAALDKLTKELEGQRAFALRAMDEVRGETRAVRDELAYVKGRFKECERELDTYRQMILTRGQGGGNGGLR